MLGSKRLLMLTLTILLAGCMQNNTQESEQDHSSSQPIKYETEQNQNDQGGDDGPDHKYKNVNDGEGHSDQYTNNLSMAISDKLKERRDIKQAQTAVSDDKVVVGLMLTDKASPDVRDIVQKEVRDMVPERDVQVYTDDSYWDRMRNKDAELDQLNGDMREYLQEFFTRDREDF